MYILYMIIFNYIGVDDLKIVGINKIFTYLYIYILYILFL